MHGRMYEQVSVYRQSGNTIIPSDKSFSTSKFLLLVHGSVSFEQLQQGLRRLEDYLRTQSSRREKLVIKMRRCTYECIYLCVIMVNRCAITMRSSSNVPKGWSGSRHIRKEVT